MFDLSPLEWLGTLTVCLIVGAIFTVFVSWISAEEDDR